ncbi:MAG: hypothetical protein NTX25_06805 [Proteobacteria bacterium]|nr:hypothetical protein [Pseudomonadota bacterium]
MGLFLACEKKSTTTDEELTTSTESGVTTNTANTLAIGGKLELSLEARLAGTTMGVVLFTLDSSSTLVDKPLKITVADDGTFTTPIERDRLEKIKTGIVNGVPDRTVLKKLFPNDADAIDAASDAEIVKGLSEQLTELEKNPNLRYVLVSYEISGDLEAEAKSMQFIGLPTGGPPLKMLPGEALLGDLSLGLITGSGDEASSELAASDSLDLPASVIEELAGTSQTLKYLKNVWMNPVDKIIVTPWFSYINSDIASTVNKFTTPAGLTYGGGGYYMSPRDIGATWGEVCPPNPANASDASGSIYSATPAKVVSFYPPSDMTSIYSDEIYSPTHPYTNAGKTYKREDQYGEIACSKADIAGGGMYTRAKKETDKEFQLQLGEQITGKTPIGIWRLKVDGTEQGRWDLSAAKPYDADGDPVIYIPAIKVVTNDAGLATSFEAKFYFYDKATKAFREVTNLKGLEGLVNGFNMDGGYSKDHDGGDLSVEGITFESGIVKGAFTTAQQAIYPCPADATSVQCINKLGFSYHIGAISYRMSIDKNSSP